MSKWAEYVKELRNVDTIEDGDSFATYIISGSDCYIEDVFVVKDRRMEYVGSKLVNRVKAMAKEYGCKTMSATVNCVTSDPTLSMKACLGYGFRVLGARENLIILSMEI